MADICMCTGKGCHEREKCYRFTATPNPYRQSYFAELPPMKNGKCTEFWSNESRGAKRDAADPNSF